MKKMTFTIWVGGDDREHLVHKCTIFNIGDNGSQGSFDGSYRSAGRSADTLSSSG